MAPKTSTSAKRKAPAPTPASDSPAPPGKRANTASSTKPSAPAKGKATAVDPPPPPPPAAASASSTVAATSSSSAAAATTSTNTASTAASTSTTNPVFDAGTSDVLLKEYAALQLLGLQHRDRAGPISSDEEEGLGSWTEKDEDRWLATLVQVQGYTGDELDVYEILRCREHPRRKGFYQYRVAWRGCPIYGCSWEPASTLTSKDEDFWDHKGPKPDYIPDDPDSEDQDMSDHSSDTDCPTFHNLDIRRTRKKLAKMRKTWRRDKHDLRFFKQIRTKARRAWAAMGGIPVVSSEDETGKLPDGVDPAAPPVSAAEAKASATASKAKDSRPIPKASGSSSKTTKAASSTTAKGKGKAAATNKSPPPSERPAPRRKGTKVTVPVEEDPSDGDVEDEGDGMC